MAMMGFNDDDWFLRAIMGFQLQLWVFNGNYGFSMAIMGFNGNHGFAIVLVHSCTFDIFFHYRSIRIYTHVLLVFLVLM